MQISVKQNMHTVTRFYRQTANSTEGIAETDSDAVMFYKKYGFNIK